MLHLSSRILYPVVAILSVLSCSAQCAQAGDKLRLEFNRPNIGSIEGREEAVFYEVVVRSFQDSNGDGMGDLNGLISRLDYLSDGKAENISIPWS